MKYTGFYANCCDTTFWVKYGVEQNASDIEHCPSCGEEYEPGKFEKEEVKKLDGLIVGVDAVKSR